MSKITLAIETSCDETSASIVKDGREVLSNIVYSQIEIHKKFGGVVPEVASRNHVLKISQVVDQSLAEANMTFDDIDFISVTNGPGLVGALLVGLSYAKALSFSLGIPLVPVNHIEGHIYANFIQFKALEPPFLSLIVSGGHTHLVYVTDYGQYEILGRTRDDAAGESFDKVARRLGLGYPGGPLIDQSAKEGNPEAIDFPIPYLKDSYDFSFSGLKTAVLNYLNMMNQKGEDVNKADVAASFQQSVVEVLVRKAHDALKDKECKKLALAGGVAANSELRKRLSALGETHGYEIYYPDISLCTDNAAMIGCAGYYKFLENKIGGPETIAVPNLKI